MLENDRPADARFVRHIDRCLSCLACMTTCPSNVHYMHLVDHARVHIEKTWRRPRAERFYRALIAGVLPYPARFRLALFGAAFARPFGWLWHAPPGASHWRRCWRSRAVAGAGRADWRARACTRRPAKGARVWRCLPVAPSRCSIPTINDAAVELLTRFGVEVVVARGEGCCGALVHHMGRDKRTRWRRRGAISTPGSASSTAASTRRARCDRHHHVGLRHDDQGLRPHAAPRCANTPRRQRGFPRSPWTSANSCGDLNLPDSGAGNGLRLAYHSACSLQHGQRVREQPKRLLAKAGFTVLDVPEGHLCCGSAGTYNILQSEIAAKLKRAQDRQPAEPEARPDRRRQYRLHCPDRFGHENPDPAHRATAQLGLWRTPAGRIAALRNRQPRKPRRQIE